MSDSKAIPFLDLVAPHEALKDELVEVFRAALGKGGFVGGPMVEEFESDFAAFCGAEHCVGVASGTDALLFALIAAGVKAGEIVVTTPSTFIATAEAITQAGAQPDFVDVDPRTYNMDPARLEEYLDGKCDRDPATGRLIHRATGRAVAAVLPVHLYGQPADMDRIRDLAERYGVMVIEDACQAHGAEYYSERAGAWQKAGSMAKAAAFSFYPGKNLGACGEGGAVTTNDAGMAKHMRMLRDHGQAKKYYHDIEGYNGRLDAIQAGILRVKLAHLGGWNEQRRAAAAKYRELFGAASAQVTLPYEPSWARAVYHLFVIEVPERDRVQKRLAERKIGTGIHYPIPLHLQKAYERLGYGKGSFPVAEAAAGRILSLPMFPELGEAEQSRVVEEIMEALPVSQSKAYGA